MKKFFSLIFFIFTFHFSLFTFARDLSFKPGYEAFLSKDYAGAVTLLKGSPVSKNHALFDYYLWALGRSQIETGDYEAGIKNLEELIRSEPRSLFVDGAKVNIGKGLQLKGEATRAKEYLKGILPGLAEEVKGEALYYLGLAEIQSGEREAGIGRLKEVYLKYPASSVGSDAAAKLQEQGISLQFSPNDLMARADRLFEAKSFSGARQAYEAVIQTTDPSLINLAKVKKGETLYQLKRYGDAVLYLEAPSGSSLPSELARSALLHLGISLQKEGNDSQAQVIFERVDKNFPGSVQGEEALYRLGKMALDAGDNSRAASLFRRLGGGYPHGNFRDKGLWSMGWGAYRRGDWPKALEFLNLLEKGATDFPTQGKAVYWQAKTIEKQGDPKKAAPEFLRAAQVSPYSYYGFMALKHLKGSKEVRETPLVPVEWKVAKGDPPAAPEASDSLEGLHHFRKAEALDRYDMGKQSLVELGEAVKRSQGRTSELLKVLEAARKTEAYFMPILLSQKYWENFKPVFSDPRSAEDTRTRLQYPFAFRSEIQRAASEFNLSPHFVVALMRQESSFEPWVVSSANAQGLMQLLPATARARAKAIGETVGDLFDPAQNIRLGSAELSALLDRFSGNWVDAIAGYNAGPGRPPQWEAQFGSLPLDEFIEEIPLSETNLYVKLVLRNYWTYKTLYP